MGKQFKSVNLIKEGTYSFKLHIHVQCICLYTLNWFSTDKKYTFSAALNRMLKWAFFITRLLSVRPSACLCACLPIPLSDCRSACLSVCLLFRPSFRLPSDSVQTDNSGLVLESKEGFSFLQHTTLLLCITIQGSKSVSVKFDTLRKKTQIRKHPTVY